MVAVLAMLAGLVVAGPAVPMGAPAPRPGPAPLPGSEARPAPGVAQQPGLRIVEAAAIAPEALLYEARAVVVFADTPADPLFIQQRALLERDPAPLTTRDAVVIVDADPASATPWRQRLRPQGFSLVVLAKDGSIVERKPVPWDAREIGRAIDKTPERRSELLRARVGP